MAFSAVVMEHFLHPRHAGPLAERTHEGWSGNVQSSRFMRIQVVVGDDRIVDAHFATYGCAPAIAAGSYLCTWLIGKPMAEALAYTSDQLTTDLGGLPEARRFCADLAIDALRDALQHGGAPT